MSSMMMSLVREFTAAATASVTATATGYLGEERENKR